MSGEDEPGEARDPDAPRPTVVDMLSLPEPAGALVSWLMRRREARLSDIAAYLGQDEQAAQDLLAPLIEQGFVQVQSRGGERYFLARIASTPARSARKAVRDLLYDL